VTLVVICHLVEFTLDPYTAQGSSDFSDFLHYPAFHSPTTQ